jgi:GntR family transcriptional regulator
VTEPARRRARPRGGRGASLAGDVAAELRSAVHAGAFRAGDRLPSEPELAQRLGISRATLREAVRILVEEGYLRRMHGSGTYVARRPTLRNNLDINFGVTDLIRAMGRRPSTVEAYVELEQADADTAAALDLEEGADVVMLRRVRAADGTPVVLSIDVYPADLLDPGSGDELEVPEESIYAHLAGRGVHVDHGVARVAPAVADASVSKRLRVGVGTLLLYLHQVDYDRDGEPVVLSREYHVADAFEFTVYRKGPYLIEAAAVPGPT